MDTSQSKMLSAQTAKENLAYRQIPYKLGSACLQRMAFSKIRKGVVAVILECSRSSGHEQRLVQRNRAHKPFVH
jgi:hypothetical protein